MVAGPISASLRVPQRAALRSQGCALSLAGAHSLSSHSPAAACSYGSCVRPVAASLRLQNLMVAGPISASLRVPQLAAFIRSRWLAAFLSLALVHFSAPSPGPRSVDGCGPHLRFASSPATGRSSVSRLRSLARWRSLALFAFAGGRVFLRFMREARCRVSSTPEPDGCGPHLRFASSPATGRSSVSRLRSLARWRSLALFAFAGGRVFLRFPSPLRFEPRNGPLFGLKAALSRSLALTRSLRIRRRPGVPTVHA